MTIVAEMVTRWNREQRAEPGARIVAIADALPETRAMESGPNRPQSPGAPTAPIPLRDVVVLALALLAAVGCGGAGEMPAPPCPGASPLASAGQGESPCALVGQLCSFDKVSCRCEKSSMDGVNRASWWCNSPECYPGPTPSDDSCAAPGVACSYGYKSGCGCVDPERRWVCSCPGVTPSPRTRPSEGGVCGCVLGADYGDCALGDAVSCECHLARWHCAAKACGNPDMAARD